MKIQTIATETRFGMRVESGPPPLALQPWRRMIVALQRSVYQAHSSCPNARLPAVQSASPAQSTRLLPSLRSTMALARGRPGCSHRLVQRRLPWLIFIGIVHVEPAIVGSGSPDPPPPPGGPASSESADALAGGVGWSCMRDTGNGQDDATHADGMVLSVVLRPHSPAAMAV